MAAERLAGKRVAIVLNTETKVDAGSSIKADRDRGIVTSLLAIVKTTATPPTPPTRLPPVVFTFKWTPDVPGAVIEFLIDRPEMLKDGNLAVSLRELYTNGEGRQFHIASGDEIFVDGVPLRESGFEIRLNDDDVAGMYHLLMPKAAAPMGTRAMPQRFRVSTAEFGNVYGFVRYLWENSYPEDKKPPFSAYDKRNVRTEIGPTGRFDVVCGRKLFTRYFKAHTRATEIWLETYFDEEYGQGKFERILNAYVARLQQVPLLFGRELRLTFDMKSRSKLSNTGLIRQMGVVVLCPAAANVVIPLVPDVAMADVATATISISNRDMLWLHNGCLQFLIRVEFRTDDIERRFETYVLEKTGKDALVVLGTPDVAIRLLTPRSGDGGFHSAVLASSA